MALPDKPITRKEMYLSNMAGQGTPLPEAPITREEAYLDAIAKQGGGGGTGDGDMKKSVYDSDLSIQNAGGIKEYVNNRGFITNTVNNLANYYLKTQTYTQTEVDALIAAVKNGRFISVATLPTTDIDTKAIYLVPSADPKVGNVKDEYINTDGTSAGWELIGSTAIDLSGYVTDAELTAALADYTTTTDLTTLLDGKADKATSYQSTDTAETTLADGDYFPFYDTSASAKRKTLWSNIKSGLKAYFDKLYSTIKTLAGLTDTTISSPVSGQILEYDGSKWVNGDNIKEFARFGGSKTFSQLTSSLLTAANVDKFFLITDGGTISSADAGNWVLPAGSVIPADAHIAVIEYSAGVYKFDDFGGYIDISGKADKTQLDGWTATSIVQSDNTVTFTGLNDAYGYDLFCDDKLIGISSMTKTGSGTNVTITYTVTGAASGDVCKLRILK